MSLTRSPVRVETSLQQWHTGDSLHLGPLTTPQVALQLLQ